MNAKVNWINQMQQVILLVDYKQREREGERGRERVLLLALELDTRSFKTRQQQ